MRSRFYTFYYSKCEYKQSVWITHSDNYPYHSIFLFKFTYTTNNPRNPYCKILHYSTIKSAFFIPFYTPYAQLSTPFHSVSCTFSHFLSKQ